MDAFRNNKKLDLNRLSDLPLNMDEEHEGDSENADGRRKCEHLGDDFVVQVQKHKAETRQQEDEMLSELSTLDGFSPRDTRSSHFSERDTWRSTGRSSSRYTDQQVERASFKRISRNTASSCSTSVRPTLERSTFEELPYASEAVVAGAASLLKMRSRGKTSHEDELGMLTELPAKAPRNPSSRPPRMQSFRMRNFAPPGGSSSSSSTTPLAKRIVSPELDYFSEVSTESGSATNSRTVTLDSVLASDHINGIETPGAQSPEPTEALVPELPTTPKSNRPVSKMVSEQADESA